MPAVDPLRNTLDRLALDPAAQADRPYLVSVLRRLGYSETEIETYLATRGTPAAAAAAPVVAAAPPAPAAEGDRVIELEYTGPGLRDFLLVTPVDETEFGLDELGLAEGLEAGEEAISAGPSMEEVDRLVAEGSLTDFDDWGEGGGPPPEEVAVAKGPGEEPDDFAGGEPGAEAGAEGETPLDLQAAESSGETLDLPPPGEAGPDFGKGEPPAAKEELVEFAAGPTEEFVEFGETQPASAVDGEGWLEGAAGEAPGEALGEAAAGAPFQYEEWTLYSRDVELPTGKAQRIYFFSKGEPKSGAPSPLPPGYEVGVNDRTGLPYLRRSADPDIPSVSDSDPGTPGAPRKRVRIQRVRAASREEAEAKMATEGRNVIASVPIDIEEQWDDP